MLDLTDFGPNPHVPSYQDYAAMTVRWAKGTTGSGPRRRTVLTVPEFPWVVELLQYWCTEGREMFSTADRSPALWPSERGGRLTIICPFRNRPDPLVFVSGLTLDGVDHRHLVLFDGRRHNIPGGRGHLLKSG